MKLVFKNCLLLGLWLSLRFDYFEIENKDLKLFIFCVVILFEYGYCIVKIKI